MEAVNYYGLSEDEYLVVQEEHNYLKKMAKKIGKEDQVASIERLIQIRKEEKNSKKARDKQKILDIYKRIVCFSEQTGQDITLPNLLSREGYDDFMRFIQFTGQVQKKLFLIGSSYKTQKRRLESQALYYLQKYLENECKAA